MRKIELRTGDGHHVAFVEILPFPGKGPEVVLWGSRVFVPRGESGKAFYEVFAVVSLTPSPGVDGPAD